MGPKISLHWSFADQINPGGVNFAYEFSIGKFWLSGTLAKHETELEIPLSNKNNILIFSFQVIKFFILNQKIKFYVQIIHNCLHIYSDVNSFFKDVNSSQPTSSIFQFDCQLPMQNDVSYRQIASESVLKKLWHLFR